MRKRLLSRLLQSLLVLWAAFTIAFVLLQLMPGDAILIRFVGGDMGLSPDQIERIRAFYGADKPAVVQYFTTLGNFLTGDFGYSITSGVPVAQELSTNLPSTLRLAGAALVAAFIGALALTGLAMLAPFRFLKSAALSLPPLFAATPVFWLGILLIQVFSFQLGWVSVILPGPIEQMVLPVATLAVPLAAPIAQIMIRAVAQASVQPYTHVARAKGASEPRVLLRHVPRNAALPVLTIAAVLFGELLAGAVVTETVFGLNGVGRLAERSVRFQDAAMLQAIVVLAAFGFVLTNFVVDLLTPLLDPRLRRSVRAI